MGMPTGCLPSSESSRNEDTLRGSQKRRGTIIFNRILGLNVLRILSGIGYASLGKPYERPCDGAPSVSPRVLGYRLRYHQRQAEAPIWLHGVAVLVHLESVSVSAALGLPSLPGTLCSARVNSELPPRASAVNRQNWEPSRHRASANRSPLRSSMRTSRRIRVCGDLCAFTAALVVPENPDPPLASLNSFPWLCANGSKNTLRR